MKKGQRRGLNVLSLFDVCPGALISGNIHENPELLKFKKKR